MTALELKKAIGELNKKTCLEIFGQGPDDLTLIFPPNVELGDLAFECFGLARQLNQAPTEIAFKIAENIQANNIIEQIKASGPYINFKINREVLFRTVLEEIFSQDSLAAPEKIGHKIMVEYLSPNTNKPLHLGHLRNGALGAALANILSANGNEVIKANLVNDRGVHICKSMLAWQKWANGQTPESAGEKGDHFVGKWYVKYAIEAGKNPALEQEAQIMLQKWEQGDLQTLQIWQTMNAWVYDGFEKTYQKFGLEFDIFYYESKTYQLGKEIIQGGVEKNVFQKTEKGSIVFQLPTEDFALDKNNLPKKITLIREDGTSVYITQDLGTTVLKFKEQGIDKCIFVVGSEQNYHFRVLFKLLEMLGYAWAKNCQHLSYGMVYLPEGKMKSREGKVIDADNLISQMEKLARAEIEKRLKVEREVDPTQTSEEKIEERAIKIALAAIKFYLLRVRAEQDIYFNPEESLSFDGFTGPYCQYTYARAKSVLRTANNQQLTANPNYSLLGNEAELLLAQKLMVFTETLKNAGQTLNPSCLANYVYDLCKTFNQFYQKYPVLKAESPGLIAGRLKLTEAVGLIIKKSLNLLGIETLEKM